MNLSSWPALEPIQPPIQWVPGVLSLVLKQPGREAYHWPSSTVEFNIDTLLPSPQKYALMNYLWRDNFFFTLWLYSPHWTQAPSLWGSSSHIIWHTYPVWLLWTSDQPVAEAATYTIHNKHTRRTSIPSLRLEPAISAK